MNTTKRMVTECIRAIMHIYSSTVQIIIYNMIIFKIMQIIQINIKMIQIKINIDSQSSDL